MLTCYNKFRMNEKKLLRQSNFEILRILSMFMILLLHANYKSLGTVRFSEIECSYFFSFFRIYLEQLCAIAVNVYILISGWFSITWKLRSIVNLLVQVFFYSSLISVAFFCLDYQKFSLSDVFIIGKSYWFIVSYLLLYILSPVLNSFSKFAEKRIFFTFLLVFFCFEIVYGWYFGLGSFSGGYSALSFVGLYLLGRYLRLHSTFLKSVTCLRFLFLYGVISIIPTLLCWYNILVFGNDISDSISNFLIDYNCPFVVVASVLFFLCFSKLHFQNSLINFFSSSCLSVYLIHFHPSFFPYYKACIRFILDEPYSILCWVKLFFILLFFMIGCILIDKLRMFITQEKTNKLCDCVENYFIKK